MAYKSGTGVFNNTHQSGQGTLKMSPGSCPLIKVSGEMFTTLDDQGEYAVQDFDTRTHAYTHIHTHTREDTHSTDTHMLLAPYPTVHTHSLRLRDANACPHDSLNKAIRSSDFHS